MERGVRDRPGEIVALADLIGEHGEAIEFDLLGLGYRLRWLDNPTQDFNWRDLWVLVRHLGPQSALHVAVHGREESEWTLANHLLALIVDNTALNVWMKTEGAQKKPAKGRPKPVPRPGVEDDSKRTIAGEVLPAEEMLDWLGDDYAALTA